MEKTINKNTYAFIDSQNLNLGIITDILRGKKKIYKGWKLDFKKFRVYLKDKYKVSKAFLFIGMIVENQELYDALKEYGYELVFKPVVEDKSHKVKGNVDAELVLHTMIEYPKFDDAIIVSGDGDFHCLVEYLEQTKKLKHIMIPNRTRYSQLLNKFYKYLRFVNEMKAKLEYKYKM